MPKKFWIIYPPIAIALVIGMAYYLYDQEKAANNYLATGDKFNYNGQECVVIQARDGIIEVRRPDGSITKILAREIPKNK